jgi:hypothetical protein
MRTRYFLLLLLSVVGLAWPSVASLHPLNDSSTDVYPLGRIRCDITKE